MNRIDFIIDKIENLLLKIVDESPSRCRIGFSHLHGVANFAGLLAKKRGENVELSVIAGLLHDLHTVITGESKDHALYGSRIAEEILVSTNEFTRTEILKIADAIANHSRKEVIGSDFNEVLVDADVLHHYFHNPTKVVPKYEEKRLASLLNELNIE